ncbi:MAG TPA: nucleotidyl transferase AbiEii/AbiGii toxin family protein [Gammaproteobacteria bacterium]
MNDLREQFLERLMRELFRHDSGFILKGGGAIRALYGEQRLTKDVDLDFPNPRRTADSLHRMLDAAIAAASRGLPLRDLRVHQPGKGEKSPRWKINFRAPDDTLVHVEIEVSRDAKRAPPGHVMQVAFLPRAAKGVPRFFVAVYDGPTLIATKIAALLGREVPRDVYDLDLLHAQHPSPSREQITWAVERAGVMPAEARATLWQHLDALTWSRFETELLGALSGEAAARWDENAWTAMKLDVGEYVDALLAGALA